MATTLELFNANTIQGEVLAFLISAKGLSYTAYEDESPYAGTAFAEEPTLVDNGHVIHGALVISLYLEQRYPSPSLLPQDPEKSSIIMMLYRAILKSGRAGLDLGVYRTHLAAHGFITGERPSLVDIAVAALAPNDRFWIKFRERLQQSFGSWADTTEFS